MNHSNTIDLSLEELAVGLSLLGKPQIAKGLLVSELDQISSEEEKGRLSAAVHSLMAKGFLSLQGKKLHPWSSFIDLVTPLVTCDFSFRCSRTRKNAPEQVLLFYFRQDYIVKHEILHNVIHRLTEVRNTEQIVEDTVLFFDCNDIIPFSAVVNQLTQTQLEEVRRNAAENVSRATNYLTQLGLPGKFNQIFAEDLHDTEYRGSAMLVESSPTNELTSDAGFMLLKGTSGRMWLLEIVPDQHEPFVNIEPTSESQIVKATRTLLSS